ncbi:glycosyl hydrolase family 61-domain-containing protein [Phaeosphaeria sp. MPI-PUGE-AT-0046c]|nr:glycosyl hydrolase family 61-domain-containing protein [Phaeosphaeria sp. MPI-PUGE-AT-0046c]
MRMSPNAPTAGSPISSLDSDDMACNVGGTKGVSRVQPAKDGALLTFEIREYADDASKGAIDRGHYGPCAVYLKKVSSAVNDKAAGDGWFKLFDRGYDASTKRWCTDEIIDNNGHLSINLPKGLEGGYYLARPEILALHAAADGDPQTYTGCAQIFLESTGNLGPESTVSIPGHMKYGEPSTSWNIYEKKNDDYPVPGPKVAKLVAKSESAGIASSSQSEGLKPEGCIVENGNWCGKEVPSYSSDTGCWAAVDDCWAQSKVCWDTTPVTGGAGCELWTTKCNGLQDQCSAKNFNGPPNKGKVLTPAPKSIEAGQIMPTNGGGVADAPAPKTSNTEKPASKTNTPAKETPAAENKDEDEEEKPEVPAQSPAKTTAAAAPQAPKASSPAPQAAKPTMDNSYPANPVPKKEEENKPAPTITAPAAAPKASKGPACVPGGACVTVTEVEVVTQTVYVTATAGTYKRGVESFKARRRMRAHRA